jgi:hypothetical protein
VEAVEAVEVEEVEGTAKRRQTETDSGFFRSHLFFLLYPHNNNNNNYNNNNDSPQFAPALGSFAVARGLAGRLYDEAAAAQGLAPGAGSCLGLQACFGETFKICSLLCLGGALCSVLLALRTRGSYLELGRELAEEDEERARVKQAAADAAARAAAAAVAASAAAAAAAAAAYSPLSSQSSSSGRFHHRHHRHHPRSHALSERDSIF